MIANLKPYSQYKDSGQEWIGSIPQHWTVLRAKYLFREVDERSSDGKEELLSVSHLTGITPRSQKTITMFLAKSNVGHKVCRVGDLVINTMWAWMGALGISNHEGIVSPAYGVYRPIAGSLVDPGFADLQLRTPLYSAEYQRRSTGVNSSRLRLYPEQFLCVSMVVPPTEEQAAIVAFLTWVNARLSRAIRAKRKVIDLLREQRRVVIKRAINGDAFSSGTSGTSTTAGLGDVPIHWEVTRVKNEFKSLNTRRVPLSSVERGKMTSRTYPYYGASGIIDMVDDYLFDDDLLLIAEDGANLVLRNLPLAILARGKFWVNNHAHILKPKRGNIVYFAHLLESLNYNPWITGAAQPKLTQDRLLAIRINIASREEQDAIVSNIEEQTKPLLIAISHLEREVELLREYRDTLIADVVTGKLDVREATAQLPNEVIEDADGEHDDSLSHLGSDDEVVA